MIDLAASAPTEYTAERFKGLRQRGSTIAGKEFVECTFKNCDFHEAVFSACKFIECAFIHCDLSLAHVKACTLREVSFEDTKMLGVNWTEAATVKYVSFARCALNHSVFMGLDLRRTPLVECVAHEADFTEADLTEADCRRTDFTGSRFLRTNLTKADFRHATNYVISPSLNTLKKTKFSLPEAVGLLYALDITLDEPEDPVDDPSPQPVT
jgi:uncharacterized protein YjbI with pentapeptide repeats